MTKILFYYHHFGGYGHGMRVYSICKALKAIGDYDILVINSGKKQPELGIEKYARVLNLPPVVSSESLFSGLKAEGGLDTVMARRKNIIDRVLEKFCPEAAVIEHFPFGRQSLQDELCALVTELNRRKTKVFSSVRDMIHVDRLEEHFGLFNGFFIHEDPAFEAEKDLPANHLYTGRVHPYDLPFSASNEEVRERCGAVGKKLIVVSIGGGMDGHELLSKFTRIKPDIDASHPSKLIITTGAACPESVYTEIEHSLPDGCVVLRFTSDIMDHINAADLFVSMGGYNSVNSHLLTDTPSMIFPRLTDREQKERAIRFGLDHFDYNDISDNELLAAVLSKLGRGREAKQRVRVNGAETTARFITKAVELESAKIRVTTLCNLDCEMCSWVKKTETLPQKIVYRTIDELKMLGVKDIGFTGGEPTSYPGFVEVIAYAKKQGFTTLLSTNGFNHKILEKIIPYVDKPDISIDSHIPELNDEIRARKGAQAAALKSVGLLADHGLKPHINVTVRPDNYKDIHKMFAMLSGKIASISFTLVDTTVLGMDELKFSYDGLREYYSVEVMKILRQSIEHNIPVRIKPFYNGLAGFNSREALANFVKLKEEYFSKFHEIFMLEGKSCRIAKEKIRINSDGEVRPCCYLDDVSVPYGNVYQKTLKEILVDDRYFTDTLIATEGVGTCKVCQRGYAGYEQLCLSKV